MHRRLNFGIIAVALLLFGGPMFIGCSDQSGSDGKASVLVGGKTEAKPADVLAEAPKDLAALLTWAEGQLQPAPSPVPLPTRPKLAAQKWRVIHLTDEQTFKRATKSSSWQPREHLAKPLAEIGPFQSNQPASRTFVVRPAPAATADGKNSIKLIMGGFEINREDVGRIDLELMVPYGKLVTLKWAKAGEIPLPISSNSEKVFIPLVTDGLVEWAGPLRSIQLITDGTGSGTVVVHKIRFMSRTDSYPLAIERQRIRVGREIQTAVYAHAPAQIRYGNVLLPKRAHFSASLAAEGKQAAPTTFELLVEADGQAETVFSQTVPPGEAWAAVDVPLEKWAGKNVALVLKTTCAVPETAAFWGNPEVFAPVEDAPLVVVYLVDAMSAEHLNLYGAARQTGPLMAALASRGAWFANMFSNSPRTVESVPDIMLSMTTERHGVYHNLRPAPTELVTLADALRAAGFATASFVTNVYAGPRQNMDQGFDTFVDKIGFWWSGDKSLADRTVPIEEVSTWLDAHRDRPKFMYIHTAEPHAPYTPPAAFKGKFDPDYTGPFDGTYGDRTRPRTHPSFHMARKPRDVRHIAALYDEEIAYADSRLGVFLAALRERKLLDKVNLFVIADHGEEFLQHGAWEHGFNLHNEETRVPLICTGPLIGKAGRIDTPAALVDLMPTILDLLDVPQPYRLAGVSLEPLLRGQPAPDALAKRTIFGSNYNYFGQTQHIEWYAIEAGKWKLLYGAQMRPLGNGGQSRFALFNIKTDPHERHNALAEHPDIARRLIGKLIAWRRDQHPYSTDASGALPLVDVEQIRTLGAMGYVGDTGDEDHPGDADPPDGSKQPEKPNP